MRCMTLAEQISERGFEPVFYSAVPEGYWQETLIQKYKTFIIEPSSRDESQTESKVGLFSTWKIAEQIADARACLNWIQEIGIDALSWVVLDHYCLDAKWEAVIMNGTPCRNTCRLLNIDDIHSRIQTCNILVNQNVTQITGERLYREMVQDSCLCLLGPRYALISRVYGLMHEGTPARTELRRVLVYFGGGEVNPYISLALKALSQPATEQLFVDIVGSQSFESLPSETKRLVQNRGRIDYHNSLPHLAGLIARADLAIGSAGSTTWERLCLGLPSILFTLDENQRSPSEFAFEEGAAVLCPSNTSPDELGRIIRKLANSDTLHQMSTKAARLCDGLGGKRVVEAMIQYGNQARRQ